MNFNLSNPTPYKTFKKQNFDKWEVMSLSHLESNLMLHVSLVLLFEGLISFDPFWTSRYKVKVNVDRKRFLYTSTYLLPSQKNLKDWKKKLFFKGLIFLIANNILVSFNCINWSLLSLSILGPPTNPSSPLKKKRNLYFIYFNFYIYHYIKRVLNEFEN